MRIGCVVLFIILIAPVKLGIRLRWQGGMHAEAALGVTMWGIRLQQTLHWPGTQDVKRMAGREMQKKDAAANLQQTVEQAPGEKETDKAGIGWILRLIRTVAISDRARRYFRRTSVLEQLQIHFRAACQDAALCALLDAAAISLMGALRRRYPAGIFTCRAALQGPCVLQGVCIVRLRMGNLLAAAAMGLIGYLVAGKKKEEKKWSVIPLKT